MVTRHLPGATAVLLLTATLSWSADKGQLGDVEISEGGVVSPAVVATSIVRREPSGTPMLELLVLWRGTPGWFMKAERNGSSAFGGSSGDGDREVHQLFIGGIRLNLEFDRTKRTAQIQGHDVMLESANVVLVDDVDSVGGPQISNVLQVDPELPESPAKVEVIIRRSPDLFSFLRCDAKLPDPKAQPMIDAVCAQMKGP